MARRPCAEPGCPVITSTTRCDTHTRDRDRSRGTRQDRGYDAAHDAERAAWQQRMDRGETVWCHNPDCLTPDLPINPRNWHLGHTPDRTAWTGPEHPPCNLTEAGRTTSLR